jgi:hypothetical protein
MNENFLEFFFNRCKSWEGKTSSEIFYLEPYGSTFFGTESDPKYFSFSDPESEPEPLRT